MAATAGRRSATRQSAAAKQVLVLLLGVQLCGGQTYRQQYARHSTPGMYGLAGPSFRFPALPRGQYPTSGGQLLPARALYKRLALAAHSPFGAGRSGGGGAQVVPLYSGKPLDAHAMGSDAGAGSGLVHVPASGAAGYDGQDAYTGGLNHVALPAADNLHYGSGAPVFGNLGYPPGFGVNDEEKSVGRVKMQVYRGPSVKAGHGHFAPWGYYVWQPSGTDTAHTAFAHI